MMIVAQYLGYMFILIVLLMFGIRLPVSAFNYIFEGIFPDFPNGGPILPSPTRFPPINTINSTGPTSLPFERPPKPLGSEKVRAIEKKLVDESLGFLANEVWKTNKEIAGEFDT